MTAEVIRRNLVVRGTVDASGGVFSNGVPVGGGAGAGGGDAYESMPLTKGTIIHVDSTHANASDSNDGKSKDRPMATIDAAVAKCTANKGDVILVSSGHAETITAADGINLDVAGISVIGLGQGENRPTITLGTSTAATFGVNAANVTVRNLLFKVNVDALVIVVDVDDKDCEISGCEFREGTAKQWVTCIDVNGGAANACDRARIYGNKFYSITAGADNAIGLDEVADAVIIADNLIDGDFADAGVHNPTGKILTNLVIAGNTIRNRQTGDHAIELVSACTGECVGNALFADTAAAILDPGSLFCAGNVGQMAIDMPGFALPLAVDDQTTNLIGADNNNNAAATTNVASNADGSVLERQEWVQAQVGTLTNTGGTATLGGILGDVANSTVAARLTTIKDILDGAAGIATFPAAAAPANAVSMAEVLRAIYDRQMGDGTDAAVNSLLGKRVTRATADVFTGSAVPLFTVTGSVLVTHFEGEVTTIIGAGANNFKIQSNPTTGTTTDMCANLDIDADEVGTLWTLHGAAATALQRGESGSAPGMAIKGIVVAAGAIEALSAGNVTGSAKFTLWYIPLTDGASVVAA